MKHSDMATNLIDQRSRDYAAIKALCKGADMDKCPLVLKTCNVQNCPLFYLTSLKDCDIAADIVCDDIY